MTDDKDKQKESENNRS